VKRQLAYGKAVFCAKRLNNFLSPTQNGHEIFSKNAYKEKEFSIYIIYKEIYQ